MLVHRPAGWPPPSMRRQKSSTTRPQRSLANLPSGGPSAHTWRVQLRCSRQAPLSAYRRKSCSTKGLIGCCLLAAYQSSILPWASCRLSSPSSGEMAGVNTYRLSGISQSLSFSHSFISLIAAPSQIVDTFRQMFSGRGQAKLLLKSDKWIQQRRVISSALPYPSQSPLTSHTDNR